MRIGILEYMDFSSAAIKNLSRLGSVEFLKNENIEFFLENKDVIFIRLGFLIDKKFLDMCFNLKYICTPTTGLNHLDLDEVKNRNIQIISLKNEANFLATIRATPEHTFGLILSLLRNYKKAFNNSLLWQRDNFKGYELFQKNVGIIGFGRVGNILAKYLNAFDCNTYFYDIKAKEELYGTKRLSSIELMINKSDIILMCASYSDKNREFFNKYYINLLKNKFFINTARGELIDENYLLEKIEEGYFKGVALDVISNENSNNNLETMLTLSKKRNFIITPHIAGATFESMSKTEEFITKKLLESQGLTIEYNN